MSHTPLRRRAALRAGVCGLVVGAGGCLDLLTIRSFEPAPPFGPLDTDWPMSGYDRTNANHSPGTVGPAEKPTVEWEVEPSGNAPPRIAVADTRLIVVGDESAVAYDLEANERRWSIDVESTAHPAIDQTACYLAPSSTRIRAYDRRDGSVRWTIDTEATVGAPTVSGETVYVGDKTGRVRAIDADSGAIRWATSVIDGENAYAPVATDGTHLATFTYDSVVVLDAEDGTERWRASTPTGVGPGPVIAGGTVYTPGGDLVARDITDGEELWRFDPFNSVGPAGPTVDENHVYVGGPGLEAVNRATGTRQWITSVGANAPALRPVVSDDTMFVSVGAKGGRIGAVSTADGTVRWVKSLTQFVGYLAVAGEWLLAGGGEGSLYGLTDSTES